ncbi:hypothetical protein SGLAM104S_10550 [Streptomyces glaucescens]
MEVARLLAAAGIAGQVRELTESTRTAAEAAEALGCDVGAIADSLVFLSDDEPVLVLTSGRHTVDTTALAARWGRGTLRRASRNRYARPPGRRSGAWLPSATPRRSLPWSTRP